LGLLQVNKNWSQCISGKFRKCSKIDFFWWY